MPTQKKTTLVPTVGILIGLFTGMTLAEEPKADIGARLSFGYDSNPLRISGDGPGGAFTQLAVDGRLSFPLAHDVAFYVDADGRKRLHGSERSGADYGTGDLKLGVSFSSIAIGARKLSIAAGGLYSIRDSTFTDRLTGETYALPASPPTDPPTTVLIGNRFDYGAFGGFLETSLRLVPRLLISLEVQLQEARYGEDYSEAGLDSLDNRELTVEPGVLFKINDRMSLEASVLLNELDYKERQALDEQGASVPGTKSEYRNRQHQLVLHLQPADRWKVRCGLNQGTRRDLYAGYYDNDAWTSWLSLERRLKSKNRLQLFGSVHEQSYENAIVPGSTDNELRGRDVRRWIGRFDRQLRPRLKWFAESGRQRVDSQDTLYAHDRDWLMTGIEFR